MFVGNSRRDNGFIDDQAGCDDEEDEDEDMSDLDEEGIAINTVYYQVAPPSSVLLNLQSCYAFIFFRKCR